MMGYNRDQKDAARMSSSGVQTARFNAVHGAAPGR